MSLKEIEDFRWGLKICPKCNSTEGFWLIVKRDKNYVQCKHCSSVLEYCETLPLTREGKSSKELLRKPHV